MTNSPEHNPHTDIHRRIAEALAELVPDDPTIAPHPYLRRHLAEHAAQGQVLDDAHVPPTLLPWESSLEVRRLLATHETDSPNSQWLRAWARLEPFSRNVDPLSRATSLHLAHYAAAIASQAATAVPHTTFDQSPLTPVWSEGATPDNVWMVTGPSVTALATIEGPSNRPLVVAGDDQGLLHALHHDGSTAYAPLRVHQGEITQLLALPNGLVATGSSDGSVNIVDALQGRQLLEAVPRRPQTWVSSLTLYKPANHTPVLLAAFGDGYLAARHPAVFHPVDARLPRLTSSSPLLTALDLPNANQGLLFTERDTVHLFDGQHTQLLAQHAARIRALAALPTAGQYAVADEQGHLSVHDANRPGTAVTSTRNSTEAAITSLLVAHIQGKPVLLSACGDGSTSLWSLPDLQPIGRPLPGHTGSLNALTSLTGAPQTRLVTAGADGTVRSWPLTTQTFRDAPPSWDRITASALSPTQPRLLATARADRILLRDINHTTDPRTLYKGHTATAMAWPRMNGQLYLAAALEDNRIVLLDPALPRPEPVQELPGHHLPALALVPLNDADTDLLASGSADGRVCVWDLRSGNCLKEFPHHRFSVRCLATHRGPHGLYLASGGSDGSVRIWDVRTLEQRGPTIKCGQYFVNDLAFVLSPQEDVLLATAGQDGTLKLWNADSGEQIGQHNPGDGEMTAMTSLTLPTGRRLFAAAGRTSIHLWEPMSNRRLLQIVTGQSISTLKTIPDHADNAAVLLLATGERGTAIFRLHHDRI
ncbi:WD40 repeat domain-containing protein [Streptomyces sp. MN13]